MATLGLCALRFFGELYKFFISFQQLCTEFLKNIEKQLKDKEFIFSVLKFLGYTERDEHKVYIKDSGRRNPIWASFNLFLLQVELQIMEEIQSQNSSRNIPLKEIVRARSKRRTVEEAIRYLDLKFSSKQPELDKRQGDDASSYGLTRGTSSDDIKARARPPGELSSGDQTTTSSYSGSSASLSVPLKVSDSGAVDASNRSDEHTARNRYVPTAQLPYQKPLGGVDWEQITDNVLYGVNPEESQPERASAYKWEVHDQTSLSSRYPCRCDDFRRSATTREKTGSSQHVTTPPIGRPQYSTNTKGGQQHDTDSSYYTFHQLGVPHCPRLTNVGVKDPEVTGNSQHVTTPLTGLPQYSANTKGGQQHDADSSYYTFHQLGVPHCARLTNVGVKDPGVTGISQHVTTPAVGRPHYSANTKGGQQHDEDSSYYTFHKLGVPRCPCLANEGVKGPEVTGISQHVTTPPTGRPQYSANTKEGQQHDADSSYYTFHQLGVPHCPCLANVGVKDPEVTGNSQHVTTPSIGHPQYSVNTKGGQQHDADSNYYIFHQLGVPHCPCPINVGVKDPEVTGNSQHVTTPPIGRPQYSVNTKGGQQHDADSSYCTFHQLGVPHVHCARLTNVEVKDPEVQPALLNNGHSFNSSARAGASVHGINTRYANFGCNIGSDSQNIGCSGSYKSLSTKEGERRFEDRLPIIQEAYISRSSKGLIGLEGETHVRSSNHLSSNDEPSNVSKAAKAPQQQKNMSSGHRRQEHIPSAEETTKSRQAHRSQVNIESPVAPTGVFNVSSSATVQNRTNGDSTRKVDGSACHSSPFQVQNPTQDSVKGPQTGAVSVAQTTLSHEARAVEQAKKVENGLCEHCLLPASCICRSCHQLACGMCKKVYSVDICAVTKGEHEFANLKASEGKGEQGIGMSGEEWSCLRCTYVNPAENKICAMCSTTREKCKAISAVDICAVTKGEQEFVNLEASEGKSEQGIGISGGEWSCLRCTYVNPVENKICAICSTTRGLSAVELSKPGSRVCSSCTFHNKENAKICSACFRSLEFF